MYQDSQLIRLYSLRKGLREQESARGRGVGGGGGGLKSRTGTQDLECRDVV